MRLVIQRVSNASVKVNEVELSSIKRGLLILIGIEEADSQEDADWLAKKVTGMRIFEDEAQKMNNSIFDIDGEILVVSQFTLHASTKKGNRPSFIKAAKPEVAIPLYEYFVEELSKNIKKPIQTGEFGAMMQVELINDGPVTILMDSKNRE